MNRRNRSAHHDMLHRNDGRFCNRHCAKTRDLFNIHRVKFSKTMKDKPMPQGLLALKVEQTRKSEKSIC